jgi:glycine/D-amino acid oxidase-like deaminating enzyme
MSIRSGTTLWEAAGPPPVAAPTLQGEVDCEVAIVGGGITGALLAYYLVREGIDVVLVDRRKLGTGSTAASTGLLQYEIDLPLSELIDQVGAESAVRAYRRGLQAIDEIESLTEELQDPCDFVRCESLYFAGHWWHYRRLRREFDCRQEYGFAVDFLERRELASCSTISSAGAIRSHGDARINPYRFTQRLMQLARERGVRAFADTEVHSLQERAADVMLATSAGSLRAKAVVFATGYESQRFLPDYRGALHSTYALVSESISDFAGWPNGALLWETSRPYFYARQTEDGRALIGGGDTIFKNDHRRDGLVERKAAKLQKRFAQLFPQIDFRPAYAWAGTFGESKDGLAYIGQVDGRPRAYFALGYGGNGITFSMIAARLITDLYLQRPNRDAELFRFGR